jgi:hypothetical protein
VLEGIMPGEYNVGQKADMSIHSWYAQPWDADVSSIDRERILVKEIPGRILPFFVKAIFESDYNEEP